MRNSFNQIYSNEVIKHVRSPRNMGFIKNPDGESMVGNPVCGDIMKLYIKVGEKNGIRFIKDIKFQTLGCGAAIATSSIITVLVKGKPIDEAEKIGKDAIISALKGLPPAKIHCSVLADEALRKAIKNYKSKPSKK
jgi:nitrogen fixation protein NifU and related proteins